MNKTRIIRDLQRAKHRITYDRRSLDLVGRQDWLRGVEYGVAMAIQTIRRHAALRRLPETQRA